MSDSKIKLELTVRNNQQPKLSFGLEGDLTQATVSGKRIKLISNVPSPASSTWSIDIDWNDGSGAVTYKSSDSSTTSANGTLTKIMSANWTIESKGANSMNRLTLLKPSAYTGLAGNQKKEIIVEGGFGTAGNRKLCFPKTLVKRYENNRHLNPFYRTTNKHTKVTTDFTARNSKTVAEGVLFSFKNDFVGLDSSDGNIYLTSTKIKNSWDSTYVLKLDSGLTFEANNQSGITFDTSTSGTVIIVVTADFGTVDAQISGNGASEIVTFEHATMSEGGLDHPKLFSRMVTSNHKVHSSSMLGGRHGTSNLGGQAWNNKIETITIFNDNFKIHGHADFFAFSRLKSINKDSSFTSAMSSSTNKLEYTFLGCTNLKNASNVISTMDTSGVEELKGVFCGCTSMRHIIDISNWNVSNVKNASYLFEYSGFNGNVKTDPSTGKWFFKKCINFTGMFQNSSFNKNINSWSKGLRRGEVADYTDMFKETPSFSKSVTSWSDKVSGATGLATMFSGATAMPSAAKPATVSAAETAGNAGAAGDGNNYVEFNIRWKSTGWVDMAFKDATTYWASVSHPNNHSAKPEALIYGENVDALGIANGGSITIDWGDGSATEQFGPNDFIGHTYDQVVAFDGAIDTPSGACPSGSEFFDYTVKITGDLNFIKFGNYTQTVKIVGMSSITSTSSMFGTGPGGSEGFDAEQLHGVQSCDQGTETVSASIDLSQFDTSNVISMDKMFYKSTLDDTHVTGLTNLDLSSMGGTPHNFAAPDNIVNNQYPLSVVSKQPDWAGQNWPT